MYASLRIPHTEHNLDRDEKYMPQLNVCSKGVHTFFSKVMIFPCPANRKYIFLFKILYRYEMIILLEEK